MDILTALIKKGILPETEINSITNEAVSSGITLEEVLVKRGVSASDILSVKGEYFDIPTKSLEKIEIPEKILEYVPEDSASHYKIIPLAVNDNVLEIGMVDPDDIEAMDALNFISSKIQMPFKIFLITQSDFDKVGRDE